MENIRNIKELAAKHIPKIHELLINEKSIWSDLQTKFQKKINNAVIDTVTESSIPILIGQAELDDIVSINFLNYIDGTIYSLSRKIPVHLDGKFKKMIKNFIQELDVKFFETPNPAYLNWLAEFLAINKLIDNMDYELLNFETELSNKVTIDYELRDKEGKIYLIDVVSIHIPNIKASSKELLSLTIDSKLNNKINSKSKNLKAGENILILPVFWFDDVIKNNVLIYIKNANLKLRKIISPVTLVKRSTQNYFFGTVESLFTID